ncbi:unnamed protein product (macronuclear) [Paramecium tetraurelia]|uniref:Cysteine protease n=1 Tax=Paramecium tetraurelia TaxID=5888 RepID=A0BKU7_PARTE|nr:uncharacterized protein GSPATT00029795001 [Paramecium tetraurelia]CAK59164.1 unnamed protein product [Paramecium tetraurelia]|eukprot:XP_001426562.1 hypothetical protein (macronuclear) [Paramecium tetraurelia strain d4-2]
MFQSLLNLKYSWQQSSKEDINNKELVDAAISILGFSIKNLPSEKKKEIIQQIYSRTIWFTYRKNFPQILNSQQTSDAGWGCMLRSGQMIWAQILRVHIRQKKQHSKDYQYKLLCAFSDDDDDEHKKMFTDNFKLCLSPYSIQKIEAISQIKFSMKPCQWYRPDQILNALSLLHQQKQLEGSEDLEITISDSLLYDRLYSEMYGLKMDCEHIVNEIKQDKNKEISKICNICQKKDPKALAIFFITRIGLDEINKEYLPFLNDLIDLPQFQGIIGGRDDKAYYILGRVNKRLIYLDPHYIQEHINRGNVVMLKDTFFCKDVKYINEEQMSPSIALGFYCQNQSELDKFFNSIEQIKKNYDNEKTFGYISRITPNSYIIGFDENDILVIKEDEI